MALVAGTVVVADNGTEVKTADSMAEAIYDQFIDNFAIDTGASLPPGSDGAHIKKTIATMATRIATGVVANIAATAIVNVTILQADAGLQREASGANLETFGPLVNKTIFGVIE